MNESPFTFEFALDDFDISRLPIDPDLLKQDRSVFERAVEEYYANLFGNLGGEARITIVKDAVRVEWRPESGMDGLMSGALNQLHQGDYVTAIYLLRTALKQRPDDPLVLYNLGMALSDIGRVEEAVRLLSRLTEIEPENSRAWNALGIAHQRSDDLEEAISALEESVRLDPNDGFAHRNLGGLIAGRSPEDALKHLARAYELMPEDQSAVYGYGLALHRSGRTEEADPILKRAVEINPLTDIAESAKIVLREIAQQTLRDNVPTGFRPDAMMYCLGALKFFKEHPEKLQEVTFEIAMLGRQGLDINDSAQKYTLKSMSGNFSGLHLVSYMYVGLKQLNPEMDSGIDLSAEYEQAQKLFEGRNR